MLLQNASPVLIGVGEVQAVKNGGGGGRHRRPEGGMEGEYSLHTGSDVIIFRCSFVVHRLNCQHDRDGYVSMQAITIVNGVSRQIKYD